MIHLEPLIILLLCLMSFIAGFIDSIAGGGGLILLPSLLIAGVPPQAALGTNKFASIFGTSTALANFIRNGKVIWKIALFGLGFSCLGSVIGTKAILLFDPQTTAKIIIMLLPVTAIVTFFPKKQLKTSSTEFSSRELYIYIPLFCLIIGFYDGFYGPGTGTFLIFGFYVFLGMHLINASAISKVFNLASNIGAFFTFLMADKVLFGIGIPIAAANIVGGYLGSIVAIRKGQKLIKGFILAVFMILLVTLIFRMWKG
ncbi:MAG: TSUP family transporter [Pseudomonadota bacterium]